MVDGLNETARPYQPSLCARYGQVRRPPTIVPFAATGRSLGIVRKDIAPPLMAKTYGLGRRVKEVRKRDLNTQGGRVIHGRASVAVQRFGVGVARSSSEFDRTVR